MYQKLQSRRLRSAQNYTTEQTYVQGGLAVTPSQMLAMSEHGIPISSKVDESQFYDGDSDYRIEIDPMLMRGVDINDAWNAEQDAKSKFRKAVNLSIKSQKSE